MQFGILSRVGPDNMSYMHGDVDAPCTSYDVFLRKALPFGGRDYCTYVKISSGVFFYSRLILQRVN